jgi:hypothetical protein
MMLDYRPVWIARNGGVELVSVYCVAAHLVKHRMTVKQAQRSA